MALITCTECGKKFSDKAPACPNCGCPTQSIMGNINNVENEQQEQQEYGLLHKILYGNSKDFKEAWGSADKSNKGLLCPKCNGTNINITIQDIEEVTRGKSEVREKSTLSKAGNKLGRTAMIGMTGGLWALTPKRSDKKEVKKSKTKIIKQKFAICNDCGNTWKIK